MKLPLCKVHKSQITHTDSKIKMKPIFKQKVKGKLNEDASFTVQQLNHYAVHTIKPRKPNSYSKQNCQTYTQNRMTIN